MSAKKNYTTDHDTKDLGKIIARARRERDIALRNMIGSLFGR